jgi:hypothetical protein
MRLVWLIFLLVALALLAPLIQIFYFELVGHSTAAYRIEHKDLLILITIMGMLLATLPSCMLIKLHRR